MMQLAVSVLVVLSVLYSQGNEACPDTCRCSKLSNGNGTIVTCNGLNAVPTNFPTDTSGITMYKSQIAILPNGSFDASVNLKFLTLNGNEVITTLQNGVFKPLVNLQILLLHDNKIATLPYGIFDALVNLKELNLEGNHIATLKNGSFATLVNLEKLYLYNNKISTLPNGIFGPLMNLKHLSLDENQIVTLPIGLFESLKNLETLTLSDNRIATLPNGIFDGLMNIHLLDLYSNQITTLQKVVFGGLAKLQKVVITSNPLRCDCNLVDFIDFARTTGLSLRYNTWNDPPMCLNPLTLKKFYVTDQALQDTACDSDSTTGADLNTVDIPREVPGSTTTHATISRTVIIPTAAKNITQFTGVTVPGGTSELISIQREMLELMRQDISIKRKMLQTFKSFVARKKKSRSKVGRRAKRRTNFKL